MKILINCINLLNSSKGAGGAGSYIDSLIKEIVKLAEVRVLVRPMNFIRFQKVQKLQVIPLLEDNVELIHDHISWSDIYFCPLNELSPSYLGGKIPVASTILDLQHEVYPHYFKNGVYESRRENYTYAISRANGILTISNNEKDLIQKIYNKQEVYVTYLSGYLADQFISEEEKNELSQYPIKSPQSSYLIYPAIPWRHKNHYRLVEALWILKQKHPEFQDLKLILTGAQHSLSSSNLEKLINDLKIQSSIEMKGFVSDLELASLIKNAKLMIFPSLYEGFGIPVVDAMKLGTPVLTTSCAAIPEVAGDAVSYFQNPFDSQKIAKDLYSLLINKEKCSSLIELGYQQGGKYSASETAKATMNAFRKIVKKSRQDCVNLDYINVKAIPEYRNQVKSKKISFIFDLINVDDQKNQLQKIEKIKDFWQDLVQIIVLLPIENNIDTFNGNDDTLKVYCDSQNPNYYYNSWNYLFDAVINTDYVMCCMKEDIFEYYSKMSLVEAVTMLDTFYYLSAVSFTNKIKYPMEVTPLSDVKLLQKYNCWKNKRLEFFDLFILRSKEQSENYHLGQYKFLSEFLSKNIYLKYPIF